MSGSVWRSRLWIRCLLRKPLTIRVGEWLDAEEVVLEKAEARNGSDPRADGPVGYANRFAFDSAPVGSAECRFLVEQVDDGNFPQVEVAFDVLAEADAAIVRFDDDPLEFHQQVASAALDEIAGSQILVRLGHGNGNLTVEVPVFLLVRLLRSRRIIGSKSDIDRKSTRLNYSH